MNEKFPINNFGDSNFTLDSEESDYEVLITRLKEIRITIDLLEKYLDKF
tara:strand:+ start:446 stop:592 length:147 start_codon:yes stop_codon:yes gene_type:complete